MESNKQRILLIENNRIDQMAFERFVRKENIPYEYSIAGSVLEAKKSLDTENFDGIFTDYDLGDGNAFDVIVKGDRITVVNNGIVVIDNVLYPGLDISGKIGFQHHGGIDKDSGKLSRASSLVQFRYIWIKEL